MLEKLDAGSDKKFGDKQPHLPASIVRIINCPQQSFVFQEQQDLALKSLLNIACGKKQREQQFDFGFAPKQSF